MDAHYERVPYPASVYAQAHIARMASQAILFGMTPPDLQGCRVLELGSNRGLHLIAMALVHPDAQFVGIDIAEGPIETANDLVESLGLTNINFRVLDVSQLAGREGECDYLIAHGLYSWVPQNVREKVLELCGRVLAPNGVAFISFNTYPGWHLRTMVADMMMFHTDGAAEPKEKVQDGLALIGTLVRTLGEENPYAPAIRAEAAALIAKNPVVIFHDEFAEDVQPFYFKDFIQSAQTYGLQYLAEADFVAMRTDQLAAEAQEYLNSISDVVKREQYIDFFTMNRFRQTLLCRNDVALDRENAATKLTHMYIGSPLRSTKLVDIPSNEPATFESQLGASVTVIQPFVKAALDELTMAWPGRLHFDELLARANARLDEPDRDGRDLLIRMVGKMYAPGLLEVEVGPYPFAVKASDRPVSSTLARLQASNGTDVTSLRHTTIDLDDPVARTLLRLLDGTRNRTDLLENLRLVGHEITPEQLEVRLDRMTALSLLVA